MDNEHEQMQEHVVELKKQLQVRRNNIMITFLIIQIYLLKT